MLYVIFKKFLNNTCILLAVKKYRNKLLYISNCFVHVFKWIKSILSFSINFTMYQQEHIIIRTDVIILRTLLMISIY